MDKERVEELVNHIQTWAHNAIQNPEVVDDVITDESTVTSVCLSTIAIKVMPTLGAMTTLCVMFNLGQLYQKMVAENPDKPLEDLLKDIDVKGL